MLRSYYDSTIDVFLGRKDEEILGVMSKDNEFDIQGLELDWTCLVWDGDFRYNPARHSWQHFNFRSDRWQNINQEEGRAYQLNAYRVLLTRARQGMVICIPEGNPADATRLPEFYDPTYEYFKGLGIEEI